MLTRIRNCEILKPIAWVLPKLHPNELLAEHFREKLIFKELWAKNDFFYFANSDIVLFSVKLIWRELWTRNEKIVLFRVKLILIGIWAKNNVEKKRFSHVITKLSFFGDMRGIWAKINRTFPRKVDIKIDMSKKCF